MTMIICDIEWVKERALEYAEKVRNADVVYPCRHGHVNCAAYNRGPCVDEVLCNADISVGDEV